MDINELNALTVVRLKELCIANGIRGASKLNKPELIEILYNFYKSTSKKKIKAKKSPTIRRKSIDSIISTSIRSSSIRSSIKSPKKSKFLEQYVNTCKPGKIKTLDTNICVPIDGPKGRKAVEKLEKSCDKKGGVFNNKTLNCHDSDMISVTSSKIVSPKKSEKRCKPGKIKTLDTNICVPIDGPKGRKAVEKLEKSPVLRKKTKKSRKIRENEFLEQYVNTCKPGKIKTLDTNICVPIDGPKGRKAVEKLEKSCDKKGGVFNNKTLNCHASDIASDIASEVESEASTIEIINKSKKTLPRGSPVQSILSSTSTKDLKPCNPGKIRTLDKGNRCVSVNLKRGQETIEKLKDLCYDKGEGYNFNRSTYKCDKVIKTKERSLLSSSSEESDYNSPDFSKQISREYDIKGKSTPLTPSSYLSQSYVLPSSIYPKETEQIPKDITYDNIFKFPSSSSTSTVIYPIGSDLEEFYRNKESLLGLVVYERPDKIEIRGINATGNETNYILNRYEINIAEEIKNMVNLVILIYHVDKDLEKDFNESNVIRVLPPNLKILELQNNIMIDLTIPNDIIKLDKIKFVNFYVFEGMTQMLAISKRAQIEYINLIKQSEKDSVTMGYYILR
jgi:hypothetical protein